LPSARAFEVFDELTARPNGKAEAATMKHWKDCDCPCHRAGRARVIHCVPCCDRTYEQFRVKSRSKPKARHRLALNKSQ
jgi:hypothetical protein